MRRVFLAFVAGLVLPVCQAWAQTPREAARDYARHFGKRGETAYFAALYEALGLTADAMQRPDGTYDLTRSIRLPRSPNIPSSRSLVADLSILKDPRFQNWLEHIVDTPIITVGDDSGMGIQTRVIGGHLISDEQSYREVTLAFDTEPPSGTGPVGNGFCSGVLVNSRTVVTAAHCLCSRKVKYVAFGLDGRHPKARFQVNGQKPFPGVLCPGGGVSAEMHYRSLAGRDIAYLRLAHDVPAQGVAPPRKLPDPGVAVKLFQNGSQVLVMVGFGHTEQGDQDRKSLGVSGILSPDCSGVINGVADADRYGCAKGKEILAKDSRPVGPCGGDSGGGAYMLTSSTDGADVKTEKAHLVGLVSRSILTSTVTCGDGAIYTLFTKEICNSPGGQATLSFRMSASGLS
jgi:hypothetical protein